MDTNVLADVIVSKPAKFLYVMIPGCVPEWMPKLLEEHGGRRYRCYRHNPSQMDRFIDGKTVWTTVRNPFDRFAELSHKAFGKAQPTLGQEVNLTMASQSWHLDLLHDFKTPAGYITWETLPTMLVSMKTLNFSKYGLLKKPGISNFELSEEMVNMVKEHHAEDFDRFGYDVNYKIPELGDYQ